MKIVYLSSAELPSRTANSIHIMKMCQAFAGNGHDVTLFADVIEPTITDDAIFRHYDVSGTFALKRLPRISVPYGGHLVGHLMARDAAKIVPDLVIGRHPAACYSAMVAGMPTYFETHAPIAESGRFTHWLFRRMIRSRHLMKVILITQALGTFYRERYGLPAEKLLLLPDGADPTPAAISPMAGVRIEGKLNIGYTGHLYPGKGMEIISALAPICPEHHFHVVGGREQDIDYWKRETAPLTNITFHGHQPHAQISAYLQAFDIVLLPNQREVKANAGGDIGAWTSPLKLFEYMAAGKPIVASDIPVLREVIQHDRNAVLCPHDDAGAWKAAIDRLAKDPELRVRIASNARHDLEQKYSWRRRAELIVEDMEAT
jgi:glycosyltransferase involved in cell wall biosynthesis